MLLRDKMLLLYLSVGIFLTILLIFFGIKLAEIISHPTFYIFFWIMYLITILVIINLCINFWTTYILKNKKGIPGPVGPDGDEGDKGSEAKCEIGCKNDVCYLTIMRKLEKTYNSILEKVRVNDNNNDDNNKPKNINNRYIRETIKRICHSNQFKTTSQLQNGQGLLEYISDIFSNWIEELGKADKSENKQNLQNYLDTYGEEVEWETLITPDKNPFKEILKYDIYYWGLRKEFHPRMIQAPIRPPGWKTKDELIKTSKGPRISAYKTNIYNRVYGDHGTGAKLDGAVWITPPLKIDGKMHFPIGSVSTPYHWAPKNNKYITRMGDLNDQSNYNNLGGNELKGPSHSNVIVSGDKYWVRKPHPDHWTWKWNDKKTGGKTDVTFWNAEDFIEDDQQYRCFGSMVSLNHSNNNPSKQLGRDNVPIVCINDKALEPIPNLNNFIWNDRKSGGIHDGSMWANYDGTYNLTYFQKGYQSDPNRRFYKIKEEYLKTHNETDEGNNLSSDDVFTSDSEKDLGFGYGYHDHGVKRDRKQGIFQLLDLVVESDIESQYHKQKLLISHSGLNHPNSYLIKEYDKDTFALSKCLVADKKNNVEVCNTTKPDQIWMIEFLGASKKLCLIKSKKTDQYLKSIKPWTYELDGKIPSDDPNDRNLKPFIWKLVPKE